MHLLITHETVYRYDRLVERSTQYLRLTPRSEHGLKVLSWQLTLPVLASCCQDAYGNTTHVLTLDKPVQEIRLLVSGEVQTPDSPPAPCLEDRLPPEVFLRSSTLTNADTALRDFALGYALALRADPLDGLWQLMRALGRAMHYMPGSTEVAVPVAQAFAQGLGGCQNHAQVLSSCVRLLGLPARYVSGYLVGDATQVASHAWAEVRLPQGWLGFDVSNQCLVDGRYVRLAIGVDYADACPVRGMRVGGGQEQLHAAVQINVCDGPLADQPFAQQQ
ncbi:MULTISPECIES: transglutaminase family protein [Giesbergeria]|uniref:Transglutaminase N-terminal domain-containing protein n=1 Tax=Giesbergeria sinuosa TaxID=80883 RepID=A0ABV9Q952_9BURK